MFKYVLRNNLCLNVCEIYFFMLFIQMYIYVRRVLPRPSLVVVIWFAQFLKTAAVYFLSRIWAN